MTDNGLLLLALQELQDDVREIRKDTKVITREVATLQTQQTANHKAIQKAASVRGAISGTLASIPVALFHYLRGP